MDFNPEAFVIHQCSHQGRTAEGRYHVLTKCSTLDDGMLTVTESVRTIA